MTYRPPLKTGSWDGTLTINGVNMRGFAWSILDYTPLWLGAARRGNDAPVLNTPGLRAYQPLIDETRYDLELVVSGFHSSGGVLAADPWAQFDTNLDYLRTHVIDIPANPTGLYAATLAMPRGANLAANVRVLPLVLAENPKMPVKKYTFTVEIPGGQFA